MKKLLLFSIGSAFPAALLAMQPAADAAGEAALAQDIHSAGHKALFMCSGVFIAKRSPEAIRANEIAYADGMFQTPGRAEVDRASRTAVGITRGGTIVRRAAYRDGLGCTLLAPDAKAAAAAKLPRVRLVRAPGDPRRIAWPNGDLQSRAAPSPVASARLASVVRSMFDGKTYRNANAPANEDMKTTGVVVVHKGRIIAEQYAPGWGPHTQVRTYSAAKSVANAVLGARVLQGALKVDAPANFPEWRSPGDPRGKITLRHLLNMSSGLECDGGAGASLDTYFAGGHDAGSDAVNRKLVAEPGTRWCYANFDTLLLARAVRQSFPSLQEALAFPHQALLSKIGMRDTVIETDAFGNYILSSQIWTTPRDLARFGLLFLNDGVWNGKRILPAGWTALSRTPAPAGATPGGAPRGYGGQFWLYDKHPRLPRDTYSAAGHGGQYVTIVPSRDLVIVRMGLRDGRYQDFVADVVEALSGRSARAAPATRAERGRNTVTS